MIRHGYRPADPIVAAIVGRRNASAYDRCSCGGVKSRSAKRCWACRQDGVGGPFLTFKGRRPRCA